jgi:hypothetical protein
MARKNASVIKPASSGQDNLNYHHFRTTRPVSFDSLPSSQMPRRHRGVSRGECHSHDPGPFRLVNSETNVPHHPCADPEGDFVLEAAGRRISNRGICVRPAEKEQATSESRHLCAMSANHLSATRRRIEKGYGPTHAQAEFESGPVSVSVDYLPQKADAGRPEESDFVCPVKRQSQQHIMVICQDIESRPDRSNCAWDVPRLYTRH